MKKMIIMTAIAALALTLVVAWSCAPPEVSGSEGIEFTGCKLKVTEIDPKGGYEDLLSGDTVSPAQVTVDATVALLPYCEGCSTDYCSDVNITELTVSYSGTPGLSSWSQSVYEHMLVSETFTLTGIPLMPERIKEQYNTSTTAAQQAVENIYEVELEFEGETDSGQDVSATGTAWLSVKDN